jgi:virulence-associated protein VagC
MKRATVRGTALVLGFAAVLGAGLRKIQRWGNSLAVRIPKSFSTEVGLQDGSPVDLRLVTDGLLITPATEGFIASTNSWRA